MFNITAEPKDCSPGLLKIWLLSAAFTIMLSDSGRKQGKICEPKGLTKVITKRRQINS